MRINWPVIVLLLTAALLTFLFFIGIDPAFAARTLTSGFEMNNTTVGGKDAMLDAFSGTGFTIDGTTKRSGSYSAKFNPASSAPYVTFVPPTITTGQTFYYRFYLYIQVDPSGDTQIFRAKNNSATPYYAVKLTAGRKLQLTDGTTQIGSDSATLNQQQWYRVEVAYTYHSGAVSARIDGTQFASGTTTVAAAIYNFDLGCIDSITSGEWYMDDVALNDSTGTYQTSWPGSGNVIYLRPNAAGDSSDWSFTTTAYTKVNENPSDDTTTNTQSNACPSRVLFNVTDAGLQQGATVNVVHVGYRFRRSSSSAVTARPILEKASGGTIAIGPETTPGSSWATNQATLPRTYPITLYKDPDGADWTLSTLNSMQIGAETVTCSGLPNYFQITNEWAVVDYNPPSMVVDPVKYWLKSADYDSFKLNVDQGSITGGTFTADKFYISETPILSEPTRSPDIELTSLGHTEVEFLGLIPDRLYYVAVYRYVNGAYYSQGEAYGHWTNGFTLIDTQRVPNDQSSITIDWSTPPFRQILPLHPRWYTSTTEHSEESVTTVADPTHALGGDYYLHMCDAPIPYGTGRWLFDITQPITYEFNFRIGNGNMNLGAGPEFAFYSAETEYAGIIFFPQSGGTGDYSPYGLDSDNGGQWQFNDPLETYTRNSVHHMKIIKSGTGVRNIQFYIDDVLIAQFTKDYDLTFPAYLWFAASSNSNVGNGGTCYAEGVNMDVGPITMTGTLLWGNVDFSRSPFWDFDDRGQASVVVGLEGPNSVQSAHYNIGGITSNLIGWDAVGILGWISPSTDTNPHTWVYRTPVIKPAFGYKYSSLELLARQSAVGSVKVQVKDRSGNLVSDSYIPGNSTGFFPDVPDFLNVDLSSIPFAGIKFEITGTSTASATAITSSPLMKYSAIKFTTGNLVDVTINPVTSPTSLSTQTITGSRGTNNTVNVTITSGTVGTVTYPTSNTWSVNLSNMCGEEVVTATASSGGVFSSELAFISDSLLCAKVNAMFFGGD